MAYNKIDNDNFGKTGTLILLGNTILAPLYWIDTQLGLTAAIVGTAAFLYRAHGEGKQRRPVENRLSKANNFFADFTGDPSTSVSNAVANIAAGGGEIFNQLNNQATTFMNKK